MNKSIVTIITPFLAGFLVSVLTGSFGYGEVIVLHSGGRIEGRVLNSAVQDPDFYKIKSTLGVELDLPAAAVDYISYPGAKTELYDQKVQNMMDTVAEHLSMADWCKDQGLDSLAQRHFKRIIELDPENIIARKGLGYVKRNGAWTTMKETMEAQGMVYHNGKWITPQEKQLEQQNKKAYVNNVQWNRKISQWRNNLGGRKNQEALEGFRSIQDPAAIPALALVLKTDKRDEARALYIEVLGRLGTPAAMEVLGMSAMNDPVEEIRLTCIDELKKSQAQAAVDYFVKELASKDNRRVNRAGELLAQFGNMNSVPALIQALLTKHKFIQRAGPGMSVANGNDGASGMSMGGKDQIFYKILPNEQVHRALVKITGQNFGFDKKSWHAWYTQNNQNSSSVDLRRQPGE